MSVVVALVLATSASSALLVALCLVVFHNEGSKGVVRVLRAWPRVKLPKSVTLPSRRKPTES